MTGPRWKICAHGAGTDRLTVYRVPSWDGASTDIRAIYDGAGFRELESAYTAASIAAQVDAQEDRMAELDAEMMSRHHVYPVGRNITEEALLAFDERSPFGTRPVLPGEFMRAIRPGSPRLAGGYERAVVEALGWHGEVKALADRWGAVLAEIAELHKPRWFRREVVCQNSGHPWPCATFGLIEDRVREGLQP